MSVLDQVSDVYIALSYLRHENTAGYGTSLLSMVATYTLMQALVSVAQHRKHPRKILWELLCIFTGVKPAVDAYRVIVGKEMDQHEIFDAKATYAWTKGIEIFAEAIPVSRDKARTRLSICHR